ncbi:hypothetical protein, partial [Escherichia coli]|uniref:hypothetical protein n=1 Tax=Escherichia coli TaxID=562 RepID=UPI001B8C4B80
VACGSKYGYLCNKKPALAGYYFFGFSFSMFSAIVPILDLIVGTSIPLCMSTFKDISSLLHPAIAS